MKTTSYYYHRPVSKGRIVECYQAASNGKRIPTGQWYDPFWTPEKFFRWFTRCLNNRINREDTRSTWRKMQPDYQSDLHHDAVVIANYGRRIRHSGRNLLNLPEMQSRFPHINNQPFEN